jgi:hypothetical protein
VRSCFRYKAAFGCAALSLAIGVVGLTVGARSEDAGNKYIAAYKRCTESNADLLSSSQEPAETIATAVFAACSAIEQDFMQYMLKTIKNVGVAEGVIAHLRQVSREHVILRVIQARQK